MFIAPSDNTSYILLVFWVVSPGNIYARILGVISSDVSEAVFQIVSGKNIIKIVNFLDY